MTNKQINYAIAKACKWTEIHDSGPWHNHKPWGYPPQPSGTGGNAYKYVPNYCTDLNAMHDAEILIQDRNKYLNILASVTEPIDGLPKDHDWAFTRATARQRAEAFLRTLGKWEKVQG